MSKESQLEDIIKKIREGKIEAKKALEILRDLPFKDLSFAKVDHHRELRCGFPEVILCLGKTPAQIKKIFLEIAKESKSNILATRADQNTYRVVKKALPQAKYFTQARVIVLEQEKKAPTGGVLVLSGGTADVPIAEEAAVTAETMGSKVKRIYDVGAAGIHRLFSYHDELVKARAIVVTAGMDGVLPSIVGGLVAAPVVAVPTSVGYGASFGGLGPLLTMLNSCAAGVAVVNIDNGFAAGYLASMINTQVGKQIKQSEVKK